MPKIDPVVAHERAKKARAAQSAPGYHLAKIREMVERTRAEQGLPPVVTDALTLANVAELLRSSNGPEAA